MRNPFLLLLTFPILAAAQLHVVSVRELPVPRTERWNHPLIAADGALFLTNQEQNGIWRYDIATGLLRELTTDAGSGFGFSVSQDGRSVAYRTTEVNGDPLQRAQQSVVMNIVSGTKQTVFRGRSIEPPVFIGNDVVTPEKYPIGMKAPNQQSQPVTVLGMIGQKVTIARQGNRVQSDPFGNGRIIWPVLSPEGSRYAAVDMERGAFIANIDGSNIIMLGKCNAPQWTRDGRWIIGMDDRDDGHVMTGSELVAVSPDGTTRIRLTDTPDRMELYPSVSPTDDSIIFSTADGRLFQLQYQEGK